MTEKRFNFITKLFQATKSSWIHRLKSAASVLTRKRDGNRRASIVSLCVLFILQETPRGFDNVLQTLYFTTKFDWSSSQLLGFKAVTALCSACGQFLLFPLMMKFLGMNINIMGMMTVFSRVGHYLLLALAPADSDWLVYVAALVNCLQGVQVNQYDYDKDLVLTPNL